MPCDDAVLLPPRDHSVTWSNFGLEFWLQLNLRFHFWLRYPFIVSTKESTAFFVVRVHQGFAWCSDICRSRFCSKAHRSLMSQQYFLLLIVLQISCSRWMLYYFDAASQIASNKADQFKVPTLVIDTTRGYSFQDMPWVYEILFPH